MKICGRDAGLAAMTRIFASLGKIAFENLLSAIQSIDVRQHFSTNTPSSRENLEA
jgi:hypothetical protein